MTSWPSFTLGSRSEAGVTMRGKYAPRIDISPTSTRESGQRPFVRSKDLGATLPPSARTYRNGGILATIRIPKHAWMIADGTRDRQYTGGQWYSDVLDPRLTVATLLLSDLVIARSSATNSQVPRVWSQTSVIPVESGNRWPVRYANLRHHAPKVSDKNRLPLDIHHLMQGLS